MRGITELTTALERVSRLDSGDTQVLDAIAAGELTPTARVPTAEPQVQHIPAPPVNTGRPAETLLAELDVHVTTMATQLQGLLDGLVGHHDKARTVLLNRLGPVVGNFFG